MAAPFQAVDLNSNYPWNRLYKWAENTLSVEGQECLAPRSDRWVWISMYGNAPIPEELSSGDADCWAYPALAQAMS